MILPESLTGGTVVNVGPEQIVAQEPDSVVTVDQQEHVQTLDAEYLVVTSEGIEAIDVTETFLVPSQET